MSTCFALTLLCKSEWATLKWLQSAKLDLRTWTLVLDRAITSWTLDQFSIDLCEEILQDIPFQSIIILSRQVLIEDRWMRCLKSLKSWVVVPFWIWNSSKQLLQVAPLSVCVKKFHVGVTLFGFSSTVSLLTSCGLISGKHMDRLMSKNFWYLEGWCHCKCVTRIIPFGNTSTAWTWLLPYVWPVRSCYKHLSQFWVCPNWISICTNNTALK